MNKPVNRVVMIAVTIIICSLNVYADEIQIPECSDLWDWTGVLREVDVTEIPCIMGEKKNWPIASAVMRRWFKDNEGKSLVLNKNGNSDKWLSFNELSYDKIKSLSGEISGLSTTIQEAEDEMKQIGYLNKNENNYGFLGIATNLINQNKNGYFDLISNEDRAIKESCNYNRLEMLRIEKNNMNWIAGKAVGNALYDPKIDKEFIGAFGKATIRLVVNGYISIYDQEPNKAVVTLTENGLYFRDSYDFEGSQYLGCWSKSSPYLCIATSMICPVCTNIRNDSFRALDIDGKHDYMIYSDVLKSDYPFDENTNTISMDRGRVIFLKRETSFDPFEVYEPKNDDPIMDIVKHDRIIKFSPSKNIISIFDMNQIVDNVYKREGGENILGTATSEGTHCWAEDSDDPYCTKSGVWIRDYKKGERETALIYNQFQQNAYLMSDIFWSYYKMIGGNEKLGPPTENAYKQEDRYEQYFEHGKLIWSPTPPASGYTYPEWQITMLTGWLYNPFDPSDSSDMFLGKNGGGSGGSIPPTEQPVSGKLPDFITSKVTMGNKDGNHEKYTWKINETAYVHSWTDNIGDADWEGSAEKIKVAFYLSKGTKEDDHSEWVHIGERQGIKKDKLKVSKDPWPEKIEFKLQDYADNGTVMPGRTYNFVVCADRPKDQDNGDGDVNEKHKSNNCSTEAVFYVDYGPPRNVDLTASNLALTGGRSQLQAGEKYGLQVEISNIGTERPWNGFSSSYEIKGPGTGGVWQKIGEDTSRASSLEANATKVEAMDGNSEVAAPMVGGDYVFRACADYTQAVPETDESNNCTELNVYVAPPPAPDLAAHSLQLKNGATTLNGGSIYGLRVNVQNIGQLPVNSSFQVKYEINGPETGGEWKLLADSTFNTVPFAVGADQQHSTNSSFAQAPATEGGYTLRACVDSKGTVPENHEDNNCSELTVYVSPSSNPSLKPVYRFWSDTNSTHFYTISEDEKNSVITTHPPEVYGYEGIAYCAYNTQENDSFPLYRFWSDAYQNHFYTISETEKDYVINNYPDNIWGYEGIAWYAYNSPKAGTVPVYRFWSDQNQSHFYTASEDEKNYVIATYPPEVWVYEGIAWYAFECP